MSGFEGQQAGLLPGVVEVTTTKDGGHPVEFFAEGIVNKLIYISEDAPLPIRAQAHVYRDRMMAVVLDGLKRAITSDRAYRKEGK